MTASIIIEWSAQFKKWVVRKRGITRDDVTLHLSLSNATWDAHDFLKKEKERHDRMGGNNG